AAVRQRALAAFDALGPQTRVEADRRALITDYLLGQLPQAVAADTRGRLGSSASERAWARGLASEPAPPSAKGVPDIPPGLARAAASPAASPVPAAAGAGAATEAPPEPTPAAPEPESPPPASATRTASPAAPSPGAADQTTRISPAYGAPEPSDGDGRPR